ncbi:1-acyl-sn-glycerol-3-phosphate acyltransferase [Mycoplasma sp. 'Moose RK']|uniref:lysophospholipid acyltransferase family protein n=1 Tax=Mycoplasma sp. 'Moose RK' TaxID=2780095 RepID=UPI0018C32DAD|nr:lysophospholipid acyltransferase family protein [Mycoplasma sp. 'Moose RK']MBG0730944.1 1-acyl-sn-glycerol-3-phosphate acyltransferase [Mycoplasma sp. 'Moose RK']
MIIKLRIFLFSLIWFFRLKKIRSTWKKYTKKNIELNSHYRNNLILNYSKMILKIFRIKISVSGYENLPKNAAIVLANHNSFADYYILFSAFENQKKGEDEDNPILNFLLHSKEKTRKNKWIFETIDSVFLNSDSEKDVLIVNNFLKSVREKRKIAIFFAKEPTKKNHLEFPINIFAAAKKNGLSILPITINFSNANSLKSNRKTVQKVEILIHKPIKIATVFSQSEQALFLSTKKTIFDSYQSEE